MLHNLDKSQISRCHNWIHWNNNFASSLVLYRYPFLPCRSETEPVRLRFACARGECGLRTERGRPWTGRPRPLVTLSWRACALVVSLLNNIILHNTCTVPVLLDTVVGCDCQPVQWTLRIYLFFAAFIDTCHTIGIHDTKNLFFVTWACSMT